MITRGYKLVCSVGMPFINTNPPCVKTERGSLDCGCMTSAARVVWSNSSLNWKRWEKRRITFEVAVIV